MGHEAADRDEDLPLDEPELDEHELNAPAEEGPVDVEALVKDLADVITTHTGEPIAVSGDEAPEEVPMDDAPMDDAPMDAPVEEPMMETSGTETDTTTGTETTTDTDTTETTTTTTTEATETDEETVTEDTTDGPELDEDLVAEITRRVTARLEGVSKRENIAEKLADRIFNKLSKKY